MPQTDRRYVIDGAHIEQSAPPSPEVSVRRTGGLPPRVDLRPYCSAIEDQADVGTCVSCAIVGAMEALRMRQGEPHVDLSRLFLHYNMRRLRGAEVGSDGGTLSEGMAALLAYGVCPETLWPYDSRSYYSEPPMACYEAATLHLVSQFARISQDDARKVALAQGFPIVYVTTMPIELLRDEAFESGRIERSGAKPNPNVLPTGHAMAIVGYDDATRKWIVRNSWGETYGDQGYVHIDYEMLDRFSYPWDFWVFGQLESVEDFVISGPAQASAIDQIRERARTRVDALRRETREEAAGNISNHLDRSRSSIRDRLRQQPSSAGSGSSLADRMRTRSGGPGAGGGYEPGPGAGGGYEPGPGAGGGYDEDR